MRKFNFLFLALSLLGAGRLAGQITVKPAAPQQGSTVEIHFDGNASDLLQEKEVQFQAIGYHYNDAAYLDVTFNKMADKWVATVPVSADLLAFSYVLRAGERIDNNNGAGYFVQVCDASGQALTESYAAKAILYRDMGAALELDRQASISLPWMEKAIETDASLERKYLPSYINMIMTAQRGDDGKARVRNILDKVTADAGADEKDLMTALNGYQRLGDTEKANALKEKLRSQFPNGLQIKADRLQAIRNETDLVKREEMITKFSREFPSKDNYDERTIDQLWSGLAQGYAKDKNWERMQNIARLLKNASRAGLLNNIAWSMGEKGEDLNIAEGFAAEAVMRAKQELDTPSEERPGMLTTTDWVEMRRYNYGSYADTYAYILDKLGKTTASVVEGKISVDFTKGENAEINERYCQYLERSNSPMLIGTLEDFIGKGTATAAMRDQFLKAYGAKNGEANAKNRLAELDKQADERLRAELKAKMINREAPEFSLVNLQGNKVSLDKLKGKVVVVDFWATWCGPCKASFPGMQMAVDQYKDNPNVAFVFVNCWERGEDKAKLAGDFISSKNYTFNVLMDTEDKVVSAFGVTGIPTKFIVDANGRIRFKSIGYSGNNDALVKELGMMIDLCGQ